jgi:putative peptidoglycan lipid II flippase
MHENQRVTLAAGTVGSATLLSRVFGYLRDMLFAGVFGAGPIADAFIAAFRIPNLLRRLFGEGSLGISFIPVFAETMQREGSEEAFRLARSSFRLLSVILIAAAVAGILLAPVITRLVAYGFTKFPDQFSLTVSLTRIMFPYLFFIGMVALSMGVLNVLGHFAAPALAPVLLNLAMIGSLLLAVFWSSDPIVRVYALSVGVLVGGGLQLALQLPFLARTGLGLRRQANLGHPGLKKIGRLFLPATFGAAVFQINTLVGNLLASFLPAGSISFLYFADRIVQFPLGVFGISTATALLPSLSRLEAAGDREAVKQTFGFAMRLVFFINAPAMVGLVILREPIVALLFQRGQFGADATILTAKALLYYACGLWAFSSVRIVAAVFYAMQDARTPVKIAVASISTNLLLGWLLMKPMQHAGLALALTLSSVLNLGLSLAALRSRLGSLGAKMIAASACKTALCSAIMGFAVWGVSARLLTSEVQTIAPLAGGLALSIFTGLASYGLLSHILNGSELKSFLKMLRGEPR